MHIHLHRCSAPLAFHNHSGKLVKCMTRPVTCPVAGHCAVLCGTPQPLLKRPVVGPTTEKCAALCGTPQPLTKHPDCRTRGVLPSQIKCYCSGSIFLCSVLTNALLCRGILPSTVTEACTPTDTTRRQGPRHHRTSTAITAKPRIV